MFAIVLISADGVSDSTPQIPSFHIANALFIVSFVLRTNRSTLKIIYLSVFHFLILLLIYFSTYLCVCVCRLSCWVMSDPTLYDPMKCSPAGSSVHEIFQVRILEPIAISFSRGSSQFYHCSYRIALWHLGYISVLSWGKDMYYHYIKVPSTMPCSLWMLNICWINAWMNKYTKLQCSVLKQFLHEYSTFFLSDY